MPFHWKNSSQNDALLEKKFMLGSGKFPAGWVSICATQTGTSEENQTNKNLSQSDFKSVKVHLILLQRMNSPKVNDKPPKGQISKKPSTMMSPSDSQEQIDEEESTPTQLLERVKPDRVTTTKQDEDRRRRTIIVEKKNGSYGFTLQSYGIHYKKEQEIEMITYVDYVEYDGPAYKAGMREGDVILSINGHDMEKADHKTLVNFIKNCDTRMRMVVLFEDCVRKVELHIRYIQLQRILQSKTAELDRLCLRERELLQGKWKSQSLPARKKGNSTTQSDATSLPQEETYCRPTVSTEDVGKVPSQSQLLLAYHYLDPRYQYVLRSEENSSEFLVDWSQGSQDSKATFIKSNCDAKPRRNTSKGHHQTNGVISGEVKSRSSKTKHHHHSRHFCNPCMQAINNQDNNSLEAYDLASPCCDPQCVPSGRRKSKHQKQKHGHHSSSHDHESCKENIKNSSSKDKNQDRGHRVQKSGHNRSHKYFSFGSNLVSQFSLHSCTSSDISNSAGVGESSGVSYTTSLSSDTLYWDGNENKSQPKPHSNSYSRSSSYKNHQTSDSNQSCNPVKPKSWDNLTTKSFGGYGFGYGYVAAVDSHKSQSNSGPSCVSNTMPAKMKSHSKTNGMKVNLNQINFKSQAGGRVHSIQIYHNAHHHYVQPTKSSENLLQKQDSGLTNSSLSCECLEFSSPVGDNTIKRFFPFRSGEILYCHQDKASQTDGKQRRSSGENQTGTVSRL